MAIIRRATDSTQKEMKRNIILDAAKSLFEESDGHMATVETIAKRAKIAKGTVYLYFKTREEIYLALLQDYIGKWVALIGTFPDEKRLTIDRCLDIICGYIENNPSFMKLASIFNGILEKNIDFETAYACKVTLREQVIGAADVICRVFPGITADTAARIIFRSFAISIGLWQIAEPAPILKKVLAKEELSLLRIDFLAELRESLWIIWNGALLGAANTNDSVNHN